MPAQAHPHDISLQVHNNPLLRGHRAEGPKEKLCSGSTAHLSSCSGVWAKQRHMYCRGFKARSRPSTWCWLKVANRVRGLRVIWPSTGSSVPPNQAEQRRLANTWAGKRAMSSADLPLPGQARQAAYTAVNRSLELTAAGGWGSAADAGVC